MIKTVLLDLDDTILDFKMSERVALTKTLNELSIEPTEEIIKKYSKYNISQWKRLELGEISREEVKVNRYNFFLMISRLMFLLKKQRQFMKKILHTVIILLTAQKKCFTLFVMIIIYMLYQTVLKKCRMAE